MDWTHGAHVWYFQGSEEYRWSPGQVTAELSVSGAQDTER